MKTKTKLTLSVRKDLIEAAKKKGLNISKTIETVLRAEITYRELHSNNQENKNVRKIVI